MVKIQRSPVSPPRPAGRKPFLPVRVVWAPTPLAEEGRGGVRVRVGPLPRLLPRTARGSGAVGARNPSRALWGPCFLGDARTGVLPGKAPGSAVRVQSLDGSQHSAFRVTYRTSLRPSSSGDPRCPSSRVVFFFGHFRDLRPRSGGGGGPSVFSGVTGAVDATVPERRRGGFPHPAVRRRGWRARAPPPVSVGGGFLSLVAEPPWGAPRRAQLRGRTVELGGPPRSRSEERPFGFFSGFRDPRPDRRFRRPERGPRTDVDLRQ